MICVADLVTPSLSIVQYHLFSSALFEIALPTLERSLPAPSVVLQATSADVAISKARKLPRVDAERLLTAYPFIHKVGSSYQSFFRMTAMSRQDMRF
jgi:hypothetical protein